ncbi:hypothetical protein MBN09_00175, partial [Candidatus Saccharibacteria bacterium]|nr:hypothetical protein [Candidatus Saccharibacteria bacterium]
MRKIVKIINGLEPKYEAMSDDELKAQTNVLKERLDTLNKKAEANIARAKLKASAKKSETKAESVSDNKKQSTSVKSEKLERNETKILSEILPDAFALVREATKRVLGMRHYDVQMIGGIVLHEGNVAEMKTGEGKTLVALLPSYLNALTERGVHVVTVNEYLTERDATEMGELYSWLGLSVGINLAAKSPSEKQEAYACDITYSTNAEIGFDYLRDNMVVRAENMVQRP